MKELWRMIGRPGAVVAGGELAGTWRPRTAGTALTLQVRLWRASTSADRAGVTEQAERLAAFRGVRLAGVELT